MLSLEEVDQLVKFFSTCFNFVSVAVAKSLMKSEIGEGRACLAHNSKLKSVMGEFKAGTQAVSQSTLIVKSKGNNHSSGLSLGNGVTHSGLSVPTSMDNQDNPSTDTSTGQPKLYKSPLRVFPGDSRLCQVDS